MERGIAQHLMTLINHQVVMIIHALSSGRHTTDLSRGMGTRRLQEDNDSIIGECGYRFVILFIP